MFELYCSVGPIKTFCSEGDANLMPIPIIKLRRTPMHNIIVGIIGGF